MQSSTTAQSLLHIILLPIIFLAAPLSAYSADKRNTIRIADNSIFKIESTQCAQVKKKWIPGTTVRRGIFYSYSAQIADLNKQARKLRGKKKAALVATIANLRSILIKTAPLCAEGPTRTLAVQLTTEGTGHVESDPDGINCGKTCSSDFKLGTSIMLVPSADSPDVEFKGWGGSCAGTDNCSLLLDANKVVTATFGGIRRTLSIAVNGPGVISSSDTTLGISCSSQCSKDFPIRSTIQLQASPSDANYEFAGWSGDCFGTGVCALNLDQARNVAATFALKKKALSVSISGNGKVTSSPTGISCGNSCTEQFATNSTVNLTAIPNDTFTTFTGWGGACSGTTTCMVTMSDAKNVTASFAAISVEGIWVGTNSQNRPMGFEVTGNIITKISYEIQISGRICSAKLAGTTSSSSPNGLGSIDPLTHSFTLNLSSSGVLVTGTLSSANAVTGTFSKYDSRCDGAAAVTWRASK